jgi:hypothetical protein
MGSPDRPSEFDFLDVLSDHVSVDIWQSKNPITNRSASPRAYAEPRGQSFRAINQSKAGCAIFDTILRRLFRHRAVAHSLNIRLRKRPPVR